VEARRIAQELGLDRTAPVTNIVFMGMGEPLANFGPVLQSLPILTHHLGLHFSHNKVFALLSAVVPYIGERGRERERERERKRRGVQ
jgi:23S rRNA (adenine2503-C2)-methyltransferase